VTVAFILQCSSRSHVHVVKKNITVRMNHENGGMRMSTSASLRPHPNKFQDST